MESFFETLLSLPLIGPFLGVLAPFILVLAVVIFVHEYGHYIVGRWSGIHAEVFAVGFGPEIYGWDDQRGTRWKICWVPLGGYVKFKGDANAASGPDDDALEGLSAEERRATMQGAPLWARAATVAAGPIANFILTIFVVIALTLAMGAPSDRPVLGEVREGGQGFGGGLRAGDRIISVDGQPVEAFSGFMATMFEDEGAPKRVVVERPDGEGGSFEETLEFGFSRLTRVAGVESGGPADRACIIAGDVIQKINGVAVTSFVDIQEAVAAAEGSTLQLTLARDGALVETSLQPQWMETPNPATGEVTRRLLIGVSADFNIGVEPAQERVGVGQAIWTGLTAPWRIASVTFTYLGAIFSGQSDGSSLRGPLGIADMSGQAAAQGFVAFILLIASLSTAIGIMNLLPIPVLDGGHLVFFAIEGLRGEPVSARAQEGAMLVGLAALLGLLVFATSNDLPRLFGSIAAGC
ncbi:MAG: RIP metalloprotease RseP [Pseudomonadota bacterium]